MTYHLNIGLARLTWAARLAGLTLLSLVLTSCSDEPQQPVARNTGVYMLLDTSGTYTDELTKAQQIISVLLTRLDAEDSFAVARVDTGSFSEKDIVAKVTFDDRPSVVNKQKRHFLEAINAFATSVRPAAYTDITGGMLQATEFLNEKGTGKKFILIFSDLKEDLKPGYIRDGIPLQLEGFQVIALNVTKLRSDNVDPREYLNRLDAWQDRVETGGGTWKVLNDLEQLEDNLLLN